MSWVVTFDLDDTLYLERDFVRSGFAAVGAWLATERGYAASRRAPGGCSRRAGAATSSTGSCLASASLRTAP